MTKYQIDLMSVVRQKHPEMTLKELEMAARTNAKEKPMVKTVSGLQHNELTMAKITVSYLRELENQVREEKITYSRMVELLNEKAAEPEGVWATGFVACDLCNYEWVAVRPANCEKLECPNCKNITTFTTPEDNE